MSIFLAGSIVACKKSSPSLFTAVAASHSGIDFVNTLDETPEKNVMVYEYYYNGGGVAAADFNKDGLCDLYFTGNAVENKLYLNKGTLKFEDVTTKAGVKGRAAWKTGVTVADVNGDGWLDIYVSYSGPVMKEQLNDELYLNNGCPTGGVPTFTEKAKDYGLDAPFTFSTQATFFDYDKDGDLDMFQSNHGHRYYSPFFNTQKVRSKRHPQFGNRMYRNDGDAFTEVSEESGIHGGGLNFGLSACASDINGDGWMDLYVTNDFEEQDYLYLNNKDNTFKEVNKEATGHISKFSMGSDIADFNNDLLPDILVADMLPESLERQKLLKGPDEYDRYTLMVDSGFHHQYMRNTLQLNQGNQNNGIPVFSEIGQLAGIQNTDWSWSALFADLDNDGYKDIFITNGFLRDFTSLDFLKYTYQDATEKAYKENTILPVFELIKKMPSTKLANFVFGNRKDLKFSNKTKEWGLDVPLMSFGAAYVDLDNDGDLELVTNNTNAKASLWENHSNETSPNRYVKVKLVGHSQNRFAVGAKVFVEKDGLKQVQELIPSRGFQSSVDYVLNFGLGASSSVVDIKVVWPDGKVSLRQGIGENSLQVFQYTDALPFADTLKSKKAPAIFSDCTDQTKIDWVHRENEFIDYKREPLLPYQLSRSGPLMAHGDVNSDGLDDFFIGGSAGFPGQLFLQTKHQTFQRSNIHSFDADSACEDLGSVLFDADGDNDLDLYVVSGGNEAPLGSPLLQDRLYVNQGNGSFRKAPDGVIPMEFSSGSCVKAADYDGDGDLDLYVGGGVEPGRFPYPGFGGILRNDSDRKNKTLKFSLATQEVCPLLKNPGMITDAVWTDINGDHWPDLILVGDWMSIRVFENRRGKLAEAKAAGLEMSSGMWSSILADDFDGDGDIDLVVGNAGENLPWKPTSTEPLTMFAGDYHQDGKIVPIICTRYRGKDYPIASRDELLDQIPVLKKKFVFYKDYSTADITEILDKSKIGKSKKWIVNELRSVYIQNEGDRNFKVVNLPKEAQFSKINSILSKDFDGDGIKDLLIAGNFYPYRVQYGQNDASKGLLLRGDSKGNFLPVSAPVSGLYIPGDVRDLVELKTKQGSIIAVSKNSDELQFLKYRDK